jgi:SAM-dependent methyltransferase
MDTTTPTSPTASSEAPRVDEYDRSAWLYDLIVPSQLYHRLVWGMAPGEHGRFAERALAAAGPGLVLDAGCGSLVFTAKIYSNWLGGSDSAQGPESPNPAWSKGSMQAATLVLFDGSRGMLERARERLTKRSASASARAEFVHGNLLKLPFEDAKFCSVFHFGVLHCINDAEAVLSELFRATASGGRIFLSSLVLGRPRGDAFLRRLHHKGHVAAPRTPGDVISMMEKCNWKVTETALKGSFLFVGAARP